MPVDETLNSASESQETDFSKLDKQAAQAAKSLKQQQEELKKSIKLGEKAERDQKKKDSRGGIFHTKSNEETLPSGKAPKDLAQLSKEDEKIEKRLKKLMEKTEKDKIAQFGHKKSFLEDTLGKNTAKNIFNMGKNPVGFLTGIAKAIPFLGGVFAAKEIADFIIDEVVKLDAFLKKFVDEAERRTDLVRSRMEQATISAGISQKIITTSSGSAEPRESYNTFQTFNENQSELESNFALTNNSGVN